MMSEATRFRREIDLRAPVEELWPQLSNTDRINRALDLPEVTYNAPDDGSLARHAKCSLLWGLVTLEWNEPPWEWIENQFYIGRRYFTRGPLDRLEAGLRVLNGSNGKTSLELLTNLWPRNTFGRWLGKSTGDKSLANFQSMCEKIDKALVDRLTSPFTARGRKADIDLYRLKELLGQLQSNVPEDIRAALYEHLSTAYDEQVTRMRPFELADQWGFDRMVVLKSFLFAGRAGILDFSWEVLCPNCRVGKQKVATLSDLKDPTHCDTCDINFNGDFSQSIEVRFSVNSSIRRAKNSIFCLSGPGNTPHRLLQLKLEPGETREATLPLRNRRYYVRGLRDPKRRALQPNSGGPKTVQLRVENGQLPGEPAAFQPGPVTLSLSNAGKEAAWLALDSESWSDKGATAALVTSLQEFRDLYSHELLNADQQIEIKSLSVMFTDLKDSTSMYKRIGDASAYLIVREHFDIMENAVRRYNGSIVKTIGDAVMAVFIKPLDAVQAGIQIQKDMHKHQISGVHAGEKLVVKMGIHSGPAIVITSNDSLDYFGTAINTAARTQQQSLGGEIVLSEDIYEASKELLHESRGQVEPFNANLKGLSEDSRLWRYRPPA